LDARAALWKLALLKPDEDCPNLVSLKFTIDSPIDRARLEITRFESSHRALLFVIKSARARGTKSRSGRVEDQQRRRGWGGGCNLRRGEERSVLGKSAVMERREREGAAAIRNPGVCLIKSNPLPAYRLASPPGRITLPPPPLTPARPRGKCVSACAHPCVPRPRRN